MLRAAGGNYFSQRGIEVEPQVKQLRPNVSGVYKWVRCRRCRRRFEVERSAKRTGMAGAAMLKTFREHEKECLDGR
jgi:hypothetical protein